MWCLHLVVVPLSTCGLLAAQGLRLENKVERPLVYLAQRAPAPGGEDVLSAFRDAALLAVLGLDQGPRDVKEVDTGGAVLHSVQQLLSRLSHYSDASEMALVGILPLGDDRNRPLLVFHSELRADNVAEIQKLLDSNRLTRKSRRVHDRQIYEFKQGGVEVARVRRDLVVSNDKLTMSRVLDPRTAAAGGFASRPRFQSLRKRLVVPKGSLLFYADWRALQPRLDRVLGPDAAFMMSYSGIQVPEQLMFVARPAPRRGKESRGIITTVILQHASDSYKFSTGKTLPKGKTWHPDGWLDLLSPERSSKLQVGLPSGGIATVSTTIDVDRLLPTHSGERMRRLQAAIFHGCFHLGIDLRRQVLRRLSGAGGLQLLMVEGGGTGLRLAYSLRAKNPRQAKELFGVFEKAFTGSRTGKTGASRNRDDHLTLQIRSGSGSVVLAVVHDSLVLAADASVIAQVQDLADQHKQNGRGRRAALSSRLQRLGLNNKRRIAGLFTLDLRFLRGASVPVQDADPFAGLLGLHGGFFTFEKNRVRLEVFTELRVP